MNFPHVFPTLLSSVRNCSVKSPEKISERCSVCSCVGARCSLCCALPLRSDAMTRWWRRRCVASQWRRVCTWVSDVAFRPSGAAEARLPCCLRWDARCVVQFFLLSVARRRFFCRLVADIAGLRRRSGRRKCDSGSFWLWACKLTCVAAD